MRRNNGWLAVLAVSLVLSILRNSLAGERHPLDYGNAELPVNRSNTAHKPSSRNQNPLSPRIPPSSHATQIPRSTRQKAVVLSSKEETRPIPYSPSDNLVQTDRPDVDPVYDPSIPEYESYRRDSNQRNNPRRTIETRLGETSNLRPNIPEHQPRLSSWIPRAVIKGRSRRINPAKLGQDPARGRKTSTTSPPPVTIRGGGAAVLDEEASYYGHVVPLPSDDESLTSSGAQRNSPPDLEIERNGVKTVSGQRDIITSSSKIVRKRYLTGYSLFSISVGRRANTRKKLTLEPRRRLKNRRGARSIHDKNKRVRRSINNLRRRGDEEESRINLGDTWYFSRHGDGETRNDGFDEEYRGSSRMEDREGISGGSMGIVRRYGNTHRLNGTSKRILGVDNDREDDGARSIDPLARSERNIVSVDDGFESSGGEENSWNVTLYGASNGVDNMEEELKFDFSRDNVTDGLLDDRRVFSSSVVTDVASKPDNESYFVRRDAGDSNVDGSKESSLNSSRSKDEALSTSIIKSIGASSGLEDSSARNSSKLDNESYSTSRNIGRNFKVDGLKERKSVRNVSKLDDGSSVVGEDSVDGSTVPNENYPFLTSTDSMSRDTNSTTKEIKVEKSSMPDKNRSITNESDPIRYNASLNERTKLQESNTQRGNDTSEWNNEFRWTSDDDTITDSINGTKLRDLNGNYSQLMENKFRSESRQKIITDLINDTPNKSYLHITPYDKSRFIVQDANRISNSSKVFTAFNFSDTIHVSNDKRSTSNLSDKTTRVNDTTKFTSYSSPTIIDSNEVAKLNDSSKGGEELEASKTINSQQDSKLGNSNNGPASNGSRNKSKDRMDGTELGTWWAGIDGRSGEASIKAVSQETSMLSSVTKGSKNALENSVRGSVAAPRNPAYLKHDTNSLAEGGFAFESTGLSEFEANNPNDPMFVQSTIVDEGRKLVENSDALPERASINHPKMGSKRSFPLEDDVSSNTVISRKDKDSRKEIKGGEGVSVAKETRQSSSLNGYSEAKNFQGSLNDFLIVSEREESEKGLIGLNRGNIEENFQEIRKKSIPPSSEEVITIDSSEDGITDHTDPVFLNELVDPNRPSKGRKSRSSKVRASTNSKYNPTGKAEDQTSASTWNKDGIVPNNVPTPSIDSIVNGRVSSVPDNGIRETPQLPESVSNSSFRSTISISSATKDDHPASLTDLVTLSPIQIDQLPSPTLINEKEKEENKKEEEEEEDRSYVTPYEGNYQDFRATVDSISRMITDNSSHETEPQWPVKHSAVVEGDLVLGGLMMVHEREDNVTCGPVMPQGGVQALEAMLYTLDKLNDRGIVPGVKIGAHILDDCDKDTYGLEMAVDFIKGKFIYLRLRAPVHDGSMVINARLYSQLATDIL